MSNQELIVQRAQSQALWPHNQGNGHSQLWGDLTSLWLLSISGHGPDLDPSSLHTILSPGGWKQLRRHSWSFCWVGKGWFELLKCFQVLLGLGSVLKSPICGWIQGCTASGKPTTSKAWDISGHVWLVLGRTVGQQWDPAGFSTRNSLGINSYPSSSIPFLFPILWVSPSSLCQSRDFGTWWWNSQTREFPWIRAKLGKNGLFIYSSQIFSVSWET